MNSDFSQPVQSRKVFSSFYKRHDS
jgi:hypothetical protein